MAGGQGRVACTGQYHQETGSFIPRLQMKASTTNSEEEQHARDKLHLEMSWGMGRPETLDNSKEKKATTFEKDQAHRCGAHVTSGLYRLCFRLADSSASKSSGR